MADKVIYAMYDDDDVLKDGAKKLVSKGVKVSEVFSPFPIHGIDPIIGLKNTRLGIMAFIYGLFGLTLATLGLRYFMVVDWPMNIGGKPNFTYMENILAFIPITFEFTVLCAAHGMAITYFLRNKTLPGMPAQNPDPRTTDDRFVIELRTSDNSQFSAEELEAMVKETGIVELDQKDVA
ncbi:DUF3341 domain-containing protein [Crocinitomicaceae bacterium]|jgi:hypothetical protein|nr:DUF3341 domain-containing protein [Crocinitomicaceae bacterium]MDC1196367.1 DUF3341 domain-containing protein [Crocinitomicaceae bacterium]MDC1283144.1 DUF3341 domain-containing protein [Crocinitomicaceae bacterium]MDC1385378.1 DUF3341 domain-containing protein [Crocinitomicaceae bacterium]|tara:strand:+ start:5644 stop:6180 length:537 start_codon:yes stop_codon:yes gene_type:complete